MQDNARKSHDALIFSAGSPFVRLAAMLADIAPGMDPIDLTVGEPRHAVPDFIAPVLADANAEFNRYPPIRGIDGFRPRQQQGQRL